MLQVTFNSFIFLVSYYRFLVMWFTFWSIRYRLGMVWPCVPLPLSGSSGRDFNDPQYPPHISGFNISSPFNHRLSVMTLSTVSSRHPDDSFIGYSWLTVISIHILYPKWPTVARYCIPSDPRWQGVRTGKITIKSCKRWCGRTLPEKKTSGHNFLALRDNYTLNLLSTFLSHSLTFPWHKESEHNK